MNLIDDFSRMKNTPVIPEEVFLSLPAFIQESVSHFTSDREKDVFFTSLLGCLSVCFENLKGRYFDDELHANLFVLIVAPPGNRKGVLKHAKRCIEPLNDSLAVKDWGKLFNAENADLSQNNHLIIPADSSAAAFLQNLSENKGIGIMCESELDTLTNSQKQDWGNFSDKLRAAFHHETISFSRKGEGGKTLVICNPRLSICISGTPGQTRDFIPSVENGLFSRFIFYLYDQPDGWLSPEPDYMKSSFKEVFYKFGEQVIKIADFINSQPRLFCFTKEQWKKFDAFFAVYLRQLTETHGRETAAIVYRMGVIVFRIAMILAALRKYENKDADATIYCDDVDFLASLQLGEVYFAHTAVMLEQTPKTYARKELLKADELMSKLPLCFSREEAVKLGEKIQMKARTIDRRLKGFVESGFLSQPKAGLYQKVEKDE